MSIQADINVGAPTAQPSFASTQTDINPGVNGPASFGSTQADINIRGVGYVASRPDVTTTITGGTAAGHVVSTPDVATTVVGIEVPPATRAINSTVDVTTVIVGFSETVYSTLSSVINVTTTIGGDAETAVVSSVVELTAYASGHLTPFPNPAGVGGGRFPIGVRRTT